jgi:hypothetical protein
MALLIQLIDDGVQQTLDALPQTIFRAQRSAIGTTTTWAKKTMQTRLIAKTGIAARVFRNFRVKSRRDRDTGIVWIGFNPVKASYVGKLKQDNGGAWAGQYYFKGGFVTTLRSGHTGIFKKSGRSRLPIAEQTVVLKAGFAIAEAVAHEAQIELRARFAAKLRELNPGLS